MTAYRNGVEAALAEVGMPPPIWENGSLAFAPTHLAADVGPRPFLWWASLEKAITLCAPLWTDEDWGDDDE